jgi:integrase
VLPAQSNSLGLNQLRQALLPSHMSEAFSCAATAAQENNMQQGSIAISSRKQGPDVWQFRWSERGVHGERIYRRKVIGTVSEYSDAHAARRAVAGLLHEINSDHPRKNSCRMTVTEVCDHFEQRELGRENNWRSYSTKNAYRVYLKRWIIPHWGTIPLCDVRPIAVELWLRRLPLAKSSCAKIRNLFSVLFNHACRYEFFDSNPITFVRQGATRRTVPTVLTPAEIKLLLANLGLRERTIVLLAASTGLRQSELFALQWSDINFSQGIMSVTRSIVNGVASVFCSMRVLCRDNFRLARYPTATSRTRTLLSVNPWRLGKSYRARFAGRIEHQVVEPLSKPSTNQRSRLMLDWDAGPLFQAA